MNQVVEGDAGGPAFQPVKRRRGRPRKDSNLKRVEAVRAPPGFGGVKENPPKKADPVDAPDHMVGQAVSGFVEATFDAGYVLTVRIGNSKTNLRGIVFKPGHYVPITAENDVAPNIPMIRRNDVHLRAENQTWSHGQKLALQTPAAGPSKRKYTPPAASVPPVGLRGTVVPVLLQPAGASDELPTSHQTPSDAHQTAKPDEDVHMAEPLAMLPPVQSTQPGQMLTATPVQSSQQVAQGLQNGNGLFGGDPSAVGQGDKGKSISTDMDSPGSSQLSDTLSDSGKETSKSSGEDSGVVSKQQVVDMNESFSINSMQTAPVSNPLHSYGTGRMTELLQALQENVKENQTPVAEQPSSAARNEFQETRG